MSELLREEHNKRWNKFLALLEQHGDKPKGARYRDMYYGFCLGRQSAPEKTAGSEWLTIESAPKDGTTFLVSDGTRIASAFYSVRTNRVKPSDVDAEERGSGVAFDFTPNAWTKCPPLPASLAQENSHE